MSNAFNTNQAAIAVINPDDAFEDSASYEWKGRPLYFGLRHYYAVMSIGSMANISDIERIFLVLWIASHDEIEIKKIRKLWRTDQDKIYDAIEEVPFTFDVHTEKDTAQLTKLINSIWDDIEASRDQIDTEEEKQNHAAPEK